MIHSHTIKLHIEYITNVISIQEITLNEKIKALDRIYHIVRKMYKNRELTVLKLNKVI